MLSSCMLTQRKVTQPPGRHHALFVLMQLYTVLLPTTQPGPHSHDPAPLRCLSLTVVSLSIHDMKPFRASKQDVQPCMASTNWVIAGIVMTALYNCHHNPCYNPLCCYSTVTKGLPWSWIHHRVCCHVDSPEGRAVHQNKMYSLAWLTARLYILF